MKLFKIFKNQKCHALNQSKGFTLIELLVVIGILAVLLAITLIAINPARQFAQANNTQRSSDVNTILNAINQFMADNKGNLPTALGSATCEAPGVNLGPCWITNDAAVTDPKVDLCAVVSDYLAALPRDPKSGSAVTVDQAACTAIPPTTYNTRYQVYKAANSRITVLAPDFESPATSIISVTR